MKKDFLWLLITPITQVVLSFAVPFVYWPEMLNWPFFMNQGWLPYRDILSIHTPLLLNLLAIWYRLIGTNIFSLHLFGSLLLGITNLVVAVITWQLSKSTKKAILASGLFLISSFAYFGNHVWFENLLTPILIISTFFQIKFFQAGKLKYLVISGLLMGLALVTKQTAAYIIPSFGVLLGCLFLQKKYSLKRLVTVFLAYTIPMVAVLLGFAIYLQSQHILGNFWFFGVKYIFYKPFEATVSEGKYLLLPSLRQSTLIVVTILISLVGLRRKFNFSNIFLTSSVFLSALFAFPRFDYFHLIPFAAFLSLLVATNISEINLLLLIRLLALVVIWGITFTNNLRFTHTFVETSVLDVSNYLMRHYPGQSIFTLNGMDQIYFLTGKTPAVKPWVPQLAWVVDYYGQDRFYQDFLSSPPDIIVYSPYLSKPVQGLGAFKPQPTVDYIFRHYQLVIQFSNGVQLHKRI